MTKEDIELVIKWFANIEQLATDRKNANGIVMDTTAVLATIRTKAKACKEYVQMFGGEQEQPEATCKTCSFYENNCPNIHGKFIPYPNIVCKDYTPSATKEQEHPEVDLEKEANECWDYVFSAIGWDENSLMTINHKEFLAFARHFYELGLNARKEETK